MSKVSVVIPVYNQEAYIAECIESVLAQTCRNFEIVVVDDGSTDETPHVLAKYAGKVKMICQGNSGGASALNTAIRNSSGEYIAWVSSDDVFLPTKLEEQIKFFNTYPDIDLVYTDFYVIDSKGNILEEVYCRSFDDRREALLNMINRCYINGSTVMFKRSCIDRVGCFDESFRYSADWDLWFRMLWNFKFGHIAKPLIKYRVHAANLTHHFKEMKKYELLFYKKILDKYPLEEVFAKGSNRNCVNSDMAGILLKHGLYGFSFSKLLDSLKLEQLQDSLRALLLFLFRFPFYLAVDVGWRIAAFEQRHLGYSIVRRFGTMILRR
ncbi:MAG TPA: hypothetical protein DD725_03930 [Deltaproteobacteria bacterium]|nr:hypothetical protein [Deltaproteobacteria bacterium]